MTGIYKIENLINQHKYIGQSIDIEKRWQQEKKRAFTPEAHEYEYPLSRAIRKYGIENFSFEVIEECSKANLNSREKYWIAFYNSYFDGYNQTLGGDSTTGGQPKGKIIGVINDLKTTNMLHREIAQKWDISVEMVQGINTGRYWFQEKEEYPLQERCRKINRQKGQGRVPKYCAKCGVQITNKATLCVTCANKASRKIERPTREKLKELIRSMPFTKISELYGVSDNAIRKWCDAYNLPRQKYVIKNYSDEEWLKV